MRKYETLVVAFLVLGLMCVGVRAQGPDPIADLAPLGPISGNYGAFVAKGTTCMICDLVRGLMQKGPTGGWSVNFTTGVAKDITVAVVEDNPFYAGKVAPVVEIVTQPRVPVGTYQPGYNAYTGASYESARKWFFSTRADASLTLFSIWWRAMGESIWRQTGAYMNSAGAVVID
jgi:hypothetical protein